MTFFLISDNVDTCTGMRMAGIEGVVAHTAQEAEQALEAACGDPDVAIVLITAGLVELCREAVYARKLGQPRPLIVEVSDRHGGGGVTDSLARYVREAVGMKL